MALERREATPPPSLAMSWSAKVRVPPPIAFDGQVHRGPAWPGESHGLGRQRAHEPAHLGTRGEGAVDLREHRDETALRAAPLGAVAERDQRDPIDLRAPWRQLLGELARLHALLKEPPIEELREAHRRIGVPVAAARVRERVCGQQR